MTVHQLQSPLAASLQALESGNVQVAECLCLEAHTIRGMEQERERLELRTHFNTIATQHDASFSDYNTICTAPETAVLVIGASTDGFCD